MPEWEDLEDAVLELLPRGAGSPWIPIFFGGCGGQNFGFCLADTPRRDDRPPTHFFVKKKFIPIGGVESTTQKVSSGFCCAHTLCGAGSAPHAGGSFFLYEKSVLRESDFLRGRGEEICTDSTTPFSALKKPLKIMGIQGESLPDASFHDAPQRRETASRGLARPLRDRDVCRAYVPVSQFTSPWRADRSTRRPALRRSGGGGLRPAQSQRIPLRRR